MRNVIQVNKPKSFKKSFNLIEVVILMVLTCFFGILLGSIVTFITIKTTPQKAEVKEKDSYIKEFENTYYNILSTYYSNVDKSKLIDAAIEGMIGYLDDPYAKYMNEDDSLSFTNEVNGEYIGIGCEIEQDEQGRYYINSIQNNSPAKEANLNIGDIIIKIDNKEITNMDSTKLSSLIKGKENSKIKLTVKRDEQIIEVEIVRKKLTITSVESSIETSSNKKVGIIKISMFASNTYKQFRSDLEKLENEEIDSLIIDVRGNPGGYLASASNIASIFIKKDKIIYQLDYKGEKTQVLDLTSEEKNYPMVVLINNDSASASEMLALSLKESYGAIIIGEKSYGKGTVQKTNKLSDGSLLKYTTEEWLSPSGKSINKIGITPDVLEQESTKQISKAIEVLNN